MDEAGPRTSLLMAELASGPTARFNPGSVGRSFIIAKLEDHDIRAISVAWRRGKHRGQGAGWHLVVLDWRMHFGPHARRAG
jgi:hypothetical protein